MLSKIVHGYNMYDNFGSDEDIEWSGDGAGLGQGYGSWNEAGNGWGDGNGYSDITTHVPGDGEGSGSLCRLDYNEFTVGCFGLVSRFVYYSF